MTVPYGYVILLVYMCIMPYILEINMPIIDSHHLYVLRHMLRFISHKWSTLGNFNVYGLHLN